MWEITKDIQNGINEISDVEKLWAKEAILRQKAMRSGKMKVLPYESVTEKYLK